MKILFSGAAEGGVAALMKKVDGVHKKSGPFDVLFCVGDFLGEQISSTSTKTPTGTLKLRHKLSMSQLRRLSLSAC